MQPAPQNEFGTINIPCPRYRYAKIPLNNYQSAGSVSFQPTSQILLEWKVPARTAENMRRCYVGYQYTIPAGGSGQYAVTFEDGCDFRTVYFGNGQGLGLVDLQYADCYANVTRPLDNRFEDFMSHEQLEQFYPCNQLAANNMFPFSTDGLTAGTLNGSTTNYWEPQHLAIATTPNTAQTITRMFPLSTWKKTFLGMDKDTIFGQDMYLRMNTQLLQRMFYYTTTPSTPAQNVTQINTAVAFNNMYLWLAIEENLTIRNSLLGHLASGKIRYSIPYAYTYRFGVSGTSTTANISLTLAKGYGRSVRRVLTVPFNGQEYTNYAYDHCNVNGQKISTWQASINGRPTTDFVLSVFNPNNSLVPSGTGWTPTQPNFADDWREARAFLAGSCLLSYQAYQTQWFAQDSWGILPGDTSICLPDVNQIDEGLDLVQTGDVVYSFVSSTPTISSGTSNCNASGLIMYVFVNFDRHVVIQPDGYLFEP